ncbi:MAG: hypothetical protein KAT43_01250 [Nanoarchaeota archaeon]|nr:hypothetical protein [Nanoarchaeota archaeon]
MIKAEYDEEGNLKLPESILKRREEEEKIFNTEPSIKITKNQISQETPLECELLIQASKKLLNPERIESIFKKAIWRFKHMAKLSITKINDQEYKVKIISGQFRCGWCEQFRAFLGEELKTKVIPRGSCSSYTSFGKY